MKKPMTIEDALDTALEALDGISDGFPELVNVARDYKQAADILRNRAEEPVDKKSSATCWECPKCKILYQRVACPSCNKAYWSAKKIYGARETWTETRVLKIVEQKTDVKFEKVKR